MAAIETGANTAGLANVDNTFSLQTTQKDSTGSNSAKKQREQLTATSEYLPVAVKNDDIAVAMRGDRKGNLMIGNYIPELVENYEGTTLNVQKWAVGTATLVPAMTTIGGYVFNSSNLTTNGALHILQSVRNFIKLPRVPLQAKQRIRANIPTNAFFDMGFGIPSNGVVIVPNGAVIRCINGLWSLALTYNNSEIATGNIVGIDGTTQLNTANTNSEHYVVDMIVDDDNLIATVQNTQTGVLVGKGNIQVPLSALKMFGATALPFYTRLALTGTPASAPNLTVTETQVLSLDWALNPDVSQLAGSLGLSAGRQPFTGVQTENHTNSVGPVSATLSNTAAGYTTLGGKYQFAAVAGGLTDYALFGFQVPAGSRFICEGIRIDTRNASAAVATTASTLEWAMGFNSAAVSLATANIVRKQVGTQSFAIGTAIEAVAPVIDIDFKTPEVTESGRFVHVILTLPVGTATAAQIIRGQVMIKGRFI